MHLIFGGLFRYKELNLQVKKKTKQKLLLVESDKSAILGFNFSMRACRRVSSVFLTIDIFFSFYRAMTKRSMSREESVALLDDLTAENSCKTRT